MAREAVVTGVGALTPIGATAGETWNATLAGESGVSRIDRFDPGSADLRSRIAGEVAFDPSAHELIDERSMGRYAQLGVVAAAEALVDAGLDPREKEWPAERAGVSVASGLGGFPEIEAAAGGRPAPRFAITALSNLAAGHVSATFDARGPNRSQSAACAAGAHAVGDAIDDIRTGRADVVIAGGAEAALSPLGVGGFDAMRALSTRNDGPEEASRPFDADRDGFVIAEGAGALVLESRAHAAGRGATPYAAATGYGLSADAHHPTRPPEDAAGLVRCIRGALADADREPGVVDHVNAHATSTPRGDAHEATALRSVFDGPPPVTAPKGAIGHALGASGAIEAALAALTIREGTIPPTPNYRTPDPECDVPVVGEPTEAAVDVVASNSAGFGGTNGTLILERPGERA